MLELKKRGGCWLQRDFQLAPDAPLVASSLRPHGARLAHTLC